ncbi:DsrE family protein [Methanobacterium aggregans]|uniref:DsrE family protein n=1 Tax=Methanobacterium aggregans TaxID=1615586 RepID=UPI001AE6FF27|nr:DsrE family protein [Methanobacterium aggregans]MBP2045919.1 tRNA 2-thiouridine synthesizing protein C [Methanobacterium aggregans]
MDHVIIIIDKAPYGWEDAFSGVYIAIACLNRELNADVLLTGDGVYAALEGQKPEETIKYPCVEDLTYLIFPEGNLFVHKKSMEDRGIIEDDLVEAAQSVDDEELYEIIKSKTHGTSFLKI